jgi:hypothetical protein
MLWGLNLFTPAVEWNKSAAPRGFDCLMLLHLLSQRLQRLLLMLLRSILFSRHTVETGLNTATSAATA